MERKRDVSKPAKAIVIGAGIAGLCAARALAARFAEVTVLDRDRLPDEPSIRRGTPQSAHAHGLLIAGRRALEELFPGLGDELIAAGAVPLDSAGDMLIHREGRFWPRFPVGLDILSVSRPLLEFSLRRRVLALPGVSVRDQTAVAGLLPAAAGAGGVRLDTGEQLPAELVVDCSGRGTRSDRWLAELGGYPAPVREEVSIDTEYATRVYPRSPGDFGGAKAVLISPLAPEEKVAGIAWPLEGDRWIISVAGVHNSLGSYEDSIGKLPVSLLADFIARSEPLSGTTSYKYPASRRRRFDKLRKPPSGYVAAGDAFCSFNPVYGQGMACAALHALALGRLLDRRPEATSGFAREFYAEIARITAAPWQFATGADLAYPETVGRRPRTGALTRPYLERLTLASITVPEVRRVWLEVQHLLRPPTDLVRPGVVLRVLRGGR
ncbi:2-polyprenyl-6-methoxyphenol hydroxylase-like FAD-dependent oxidoreductase [Catenuloplanes nepalensis]|uniref:2-polyprenyl-6-methoxyphenol hydroxylase-like FAD-dependent oxidoreductase n=1 Tax=Catenuloplanes nepalensis TaxID=587533 RepID=A0ABT9MZ30_9ACTN|nr:FAD-dependent oxidoreductase [Catenuloplanes nepalensis]MDP9796702.1 2-polyprenyl-6-methoxyphenol hydroxylase-like FAD-dependent oxidoreductase [Catenuloplanes nepalensis]